VKELSEILSLWKESARQKRPAVLATVVKVIGSAYRRPGARMLFPTGRSPAGVVSGGCLEEDLAERAREVLASGKPRILVYDMRSPDDIVWGLGLGCNGEIRVLLEKLGSDESADHLKFLAACRSRGRRCVLATIFRVEGSVEAAVGDRLTLSEDESERGEIGERDVAERIMMDAESVLESGRSMVVSYETSGGEVEALIEHVAPPVSLLVFGAGSDARPLVRIAKEVGWQVAVFDHRPLYAAGEHFPEADGIRILDYDKLKQLEPDIGRGAAAVIMTHHFLHDRELLKFLLPKPLLYIGILGPRKRTENLLSELRAGGMEPSEDQLRRLHGPVGLDIGSETPEEIALAIVAEIRAVLTGRHAGFLKDRQGPLHDWPP
jgi:xanthine/CO dehydrogenase XdhC/CoxF family maturation factor